jgi:hypothetical protein
MYDKECQMYWCDTPNCRGELVPFYPDCSPNTFVIGCKTCGRVQSWSLAGAGLPTNPPPKGEVEYEQI